MTNRKLLALAFGAACLVSSASAQVTLTWNFTDLNAIVDVGTPVNFTVSAISIGNTFGTVATPVSTTSASSGYTGSSGTGNIGNAVNIGALSTATSAYYEITLTPTAGFAVQLLDFDFGTRSTGTGPQAYSLRSSIDGYASDIATGTITNTSVWSFKDNTFASVTGAADSAVTFRLFTSGGTGSPSSNTINNRIDDLSIQVASVAIPEPSTYAALLGLATLGVVAYRRRSKR